MASQKKTKKAIDASWIGSAVERRVRLLDRTDPENIYVENIRSFFNMPFKVARFFCELAVREGVFTKRVGYLCPRHKNIIAYASPDATLPATVICRVCEAEGEEEYEFSPKALQTIEVYSVVAPVNKRAIGQES